jgi:mRNA interferase RelE/StbE
MKTYSVEIAPAVRKQLKHIPTAQKRKIIDKIESLETNPRPQGYKDLVGYKGYYRVRVGDYRIIYQIFDNILVVSVIEVANRRDAY